MPRSVCWRLAGVSRWPIRSVQGFGCGPSGWGCQIGSFVSWQRCGATLCHETPRICPDPARAARTPSGFRRQVAAQELHAYRDGVHGVLVGPALVDQTDKTVVLHATQDRKDPVVVEPLLL